MNFKISRIHSYICVCKTLSVENINIKKKQQIHAATLERDNDYFLVKITNTRNIFV